VFREPPAQSFVAAHVRRGERVVMLSQLGHRIADNLGIVDVTPYTGLDSIKTMEELDETLRMLRREHGRKVFLVTDGNSSRLFASGIAATLPQDGLRLAARAAGGMQQLWLLP
jgi:hypothetical protein